MGYRMGWFTEVRGLGYLALIGSCYPEGSSEEVVWRIVAEFPLSLELISVFQGAFSSKLHHPVFQDCLHQKERKGFGKKVEKGWSHLGQEE